jgi:hypothetical protein
MSGANKLNPPPGYDGPLDPHNHLRALSPPGTPNRRWKCVDCGAESDDCDALLGGPGCTKEHQNCPDCGHGPVCSLECLGMARIFSDPSVYVAGFPPEPTT